MEVEEDPLAYLNAPAPEELATEGRGAVVAVDLLPMDPIPGVHTLQADFLAPETRARVAKLLAAASSPSHTTRMSRWDDEDGARARADVVLSDMAANSTGNRTADVSAGLDICGAVLAFTRAHLRSARDVGRGDGGVLVLKHFQHPLTDAFMREELRPRFRTVRVAKPRASRADSSEAYWVCMGWRGGGR